ncbi:MAG: DNA polymerase III subunit delta [Streptosporangiales bacterium]
MPAARRDNPSVTVVTGGEELLVDRAVQEVIAAARGSDPDTHVDEVQPGALEPGRLTELTSPSLFGGCQVIVIRGAELLGKDLVGELRGVLADPADGMVIVLVHAGGKRGKTVLEAAADAGARRVDCPQVRWQNERVDFLVAEARRVGGAISADGARALVDAVGTDLRELGAACEQLVSDTGGRIGADAVARYYRGRAEVTSFSVADKAVEGRAAEALEQLRWAISTGVAPVLVTSALAQGVRSIAMVRSAGSARSAELAQRLAMPPWKVDRVRKQMRSWSDEGIVGALQAVAEADARVKGEAAEPAYALERAVVTVARCARR